MARLAWLEDGKSVSVYNGVCLQHPDPGFWVPPGADQP